jgi:hypothetical protein
VPRERVAAAQVLLDRGWGKPRQQLDLGADADRVTAVQLNIVSLPVPQVQPPKGAKIIDGEIPDADRSTPRIISINTVRQTTLAMSRIPGDGYGQSRYS